MSNLQSDIDYIKSLAESGGRGPMRNASTLFWAGLLYGLAALAQYALFRGWLPQTPAISMFVWLGASIVFGVIAVFGRNRIKGSPCNRAITTAWSAVGIGILLFLVCTAIVANIMQTFEPISYLLAPAVLLMYGMGWWVSGQMSDTRWLTWVSLGCFAAAPAISFLGGRPEQMVAYAVCLFLLAMLPGYILMRGERA